jgi:hypothetical protein
VISDQIFVLYIILCSGDSTVYSKRQGKKKGSSLPVAVETVISWIKDFVSVLGQFQPNKQEIHLPWIITREDMWDKFLSDTDSTADGLHVSLSYFRKIMKAHFPTIKCPKWHSFHKCGICYDLDLALKDSEVKKDRGSVKILRDLQAKHLQQTADERTKFYNHNTKCITGGKQGADHKLDYASVIIDGMTQHTTIIPRYPRKPAWMEGQELLDVHCMGSLVKGVGAFMDFQFKNFKNDSNALLHTLHLDVLRIQQDRSVTERRMPEVLFIQLDNVGTNKNHHLLAYCSWLVKTGVFKKVKIGFLIAGHTHENIDQMFSRFSIRLRRKECFTLPELMKVADECFTPVPKCFLTTEIPNIAAWLDGITYDQDSIQNKMKNITHSHQFKIYQDEDGKVLVQCKQYSTSRDWSPSPGVEVLSGLPSAVTPTRVQQQPLVPHQTRKEEAQKKKKKSARNALAGLQGSGENDIAEQEALTSRTVVTRVDPVEKRRANHITALDNLRKTIDLMASRHLSAWTVARRTWWDNFLTEQRCLLDTDLSAGHVPSLMATWHAPVRCYVPEPGSAHDACMTSSVDERLLERLNPEHVPILVGQGARLPSTYERRYSFNDVQVNQLICLEPQHPDPPNVDSPQDVQTPFWIGKTISLDESAGGTFTVHWYGAEEVPLATAVPYWQTLRFEPRYAANNSGRAILSQPKKTVIPKSEMGLVAFDFELKTGTPKGSLKKHTWTLIMEAMRPRIPSQYLEVVQPQRATGKGRAPPASRRGNRNQAAQVPGTREDMRAKQPSTQLQDEGDDGAVDWSIQVDPSLILPNEQRPTQSGVSGQSIASSTHTQVWRDNDGQLAGSGARFVPIGEHAVASQLELQYTTTAVCPMATAPTVVALPQSTPAVCTSTRTASVAHASQDDINDAREEDTFGTGQAEGEQVEDAGCAGPINLNKPRTRPPEDVEQDHVIREYGRRTTHKYVAARRKQETDEKARKVKMRVAAVMAQLKAKNEAAAIDADLTGKKPRASIDMSEASGAVSLNMTESCTLGGRHSSVLRGDLNEVHDKVEDSGTEYGYTDSDEEGETVNQEEETVDPTNEADSRSDREGSTGSDEDGGDIGNLSD